MYASQYSKQCFSEVNFILFYFTWTLFILHCWNILVVVAYIAIMGKKKLKVSETQDSQKSSEDNKLVALEQKLDKLLDTVAVMEGRINQQEQTLRLRGLSPVPSAHSSLRIHKGDSDHKLPTFDELCSDDKIQAEVQRRLHQYDHTSRLEAKGKAVDALKSGRLRPGVHKVKKGPQWQSGNTLASHL